MSGNAYGVDKRVVGVLGGGQLGRMMAEAGHRLGIKLAVLDPLGKDSPAGKVAELAVEGSFRDADKIRELAAISDVLTMEIEHVNCDVLDELVKSGHPVQPSPQTIRTIQDKHLQKEYMRKAGIPTPDFMDTPSMEAAKAAGASFGYPFMLKAKRLAYDGRGNAVVKSEAGLGAAWQQLGGNELYAEKWCPFEKELSVMVVRSASGEVACYPIVDTVQKDNICHTTLVPAKVPAAAAAAAEKMAGKAIASLWGAGIFGVELFLLADGSVLLNEIAPRPHNSGHYTIEACECDQFENHIRAVLGLPLGSTRLRVGASLMLNVLGEGGDAATRAVCQQALAVPGAAVHWYGKADARPGRKMAHITFCAPDLQQLAARVEPFGVVLTEAQGALANGSSGSGVAPVVGIIMGSDSDLPTMRAAADVLGKFGVPYEVTIVSAHRTPDRMVAYARAAADRGIKVIIAGAGGAAHLPGMVAAMTPLPVVGVPVKSSTLSGVDSLYSIVQMPRGVPVATVAIGNAANAGLLAVRILGAADGRLLERMACFLSEQEHEVLDKAARLETQGWEAYLAAKDDKSTTVNI